LKRKTDVLMFLFKEKLISRRDIAKNIGIPNSTLSYILQELSRRGIIESIYQPRQARGRPAQVITLNRNAWKGLSIKIGRESVRFVLFDTHMNVLEERFFRVKSCQRNNQGYLQLLKKGLRSFEKISCIGICSSGTVEDGKIVFSPIMNVRNLEVQKILPRDIPVIFMNDVEALSCFERFFFKGDNFLVINYGTGIGGAFRKGNEKKFFDLGHIIISNGEKCYCGQNGCLETFASDYTALKKFVSGDFSIIDFVELEEEKFSKSLESLRKLAKKEPQRVKEYYNDSLEILSRVLGNICLIFKPEKVVFYGEGIAEWMVEEIEKRAKKQFLKEYLNDISFIYRGEIDHSWEIGVYIEAAKILIESFL